MQGDKMNCRQLFMQHVSTLEN